MMVGLGWNPVGAEATLWLPGRIDAHTSCTPVRRTRANDKSGASKEDLLMRARKAMVAAVLLAVATAACGPRNVEVTSAPTRAETNVRVTNTLGQAVNVYVLSGDNEIFLRQVPANSEARLPVPGVASGSTVRLRAVTIDGSRTYTSDSVVLQGTYPWRVP
jgi:hypothetical protein